MNKTSNKFGADAKPKTQSNLIGEKITDNVSQSVNDENPLTTYQQELENFQEFMEYKLGQIMISDKIQKVDADRILKKFHSVMVEERKAAKKIRQTYGNQIEINALLNYDTDEKNEEDRIIENKFQRLDNFIKEESNSVDQKEQSKSEDNKAEEHETKKKITKKKKIKKIFRGKTIKSSHTNPWVRSMNENYMTQTDSTRPRGPNKSEGRGKDKKNKVSAFVRRNEYASKLRNMNKKMSFENKLNLKKNEKLMKVLKIPTTDESSESDLLFNGVPQPLEKIKTKKSKGPEKRKNERSNFPKTEEGKERQNVLMKLLGEESIRRTYMQANKQGWKKPAIFR